VVGSYVASWAINLFGELGQQVSVYVRGVTGDERSLGVTLCSTVSEGFAVA
jgi:hypothetical protein